MRRLSEGLLGHNLVEVVHGQSTIAIQIGSLDNFLELLWGDVLTEFLGDSLHVVEGDFTGSVGIEELENPLDIFSRVLVGDSSSHHVQKFFELNFTGTISIQFSNHLEDNGVLDIETEGLHGGSQLGDGNGS